MSGFEIDSIMTKDRAVTEITVKSFWKLKWKRVNNRELIVVIITKVKKDKICEIPRK